MTCGEPIEQLVLTPFEIDDRVGDVLPVAPHRISMLPSVVRLVCRAGRLRYQGPDGLIVGIAREHVELLVDLGQLGPQLLEPRGVLRQTPLYQPRHHRVASVRAGIRVAGDLVDPRRAPGGIRTHTGRCLRPLPLPLGYRGVRARLPAAAGRNTDRSPPWRRSRKLRVTHG